jgi:hypothetical protein
MKTLLETLEEMMRQTYLTYVNDYLTVAKMAEDYGMKESTMKEMIDYGRMIHEKHIEKGNA